jgi:hypothetical protein
MACFQGVSQEKTDMFFSQMMLSDITMPHTHSHFSPIVFSEFLDRNQIRSYNIYALYEEANQRWRAFLNGNEGVFDHGIRKDVDLDKAEQPSENSWHILIDYFRRMMYVKDINDPYMIMHYISHVCRSFLEATGEFKDARTCACTRAIFTQMTEPILYPSLIPAPMCFLPVRSYTDVGFVSGVRDMLIRVYTYILGHSASTSQLLKVDEAKAETIKKELHDVLTKVVKNKRHSEKVNQIMINLANSMKIYKIDQDAHEMSETLVRDGFKSALAINTLSDLGDKYIGGKISKDPDDVVDSLLDVWSIVSPPKKKTFLSKIGDVFHKPTKEDMNNDIDAIKRERKFDTP